MQLLTKDQYFYLYKLLESESTKVVDLSNKDINADAAAKVRTAILQVHATLPFYSYILHNLKIKADSTVDTMCTDGTSILFGPEFTSSLTQQEVTFVILHEVLHVVLLHHQRMGKRNHEKWNYATDYAINYILEKDIHDSVLKISMPEGGLYNEDYGKKSSEEVYDIIPQPPAGKRSMGEMIPGNADPMAEKKIREMIEKAMSKAGMGSLLSKELTEIFRPKINWRTVLLKYINQISEKTKQAYSNRRYVHGDVHIRTDKKDVTLENVVIAVDISGSVSKEELIQINNELNKIFSSYDILNCHVLYIDTEVVEFKVFKNTSKIKIDYINSGGGTEFQPAFDYVKEKKFEPALFIYFTDLDGTIPTKPKWHQNCIWVCTKPNETRKDSVKGFGNYIPLEL